MSFIAVKWIGIGSYFIDINRHILKTYDNNLYLWRGWEKKWYPAKINLSNINIQKSSAWTSTTNEQSHTMPYSRRYERHGNRHSKKAEIIVIVSILHVNYRVRIGCDKRDHKIHTQITKTPNFSASSASSHSQMNRMNGFYYCYYYLMDWCGFASNFELNTKYRTRY